MEFLESFVAALPDPSLMISEHLVVLASNEEMNLLLEARPVGQHFTTFFRTPVVIEAVQKAFAVGAKSNVKFSLRNPSSRSFDAHISVVLATHKQQKTVLLILRDLTYEEQVERMRADFVANVSHELRTPLASISGFIETIQGAAKNDPASHEKFFGLMQAQADRMSRLTDDLLSLSRIEISEHERPTKIVDLGLIIRQVIDSLARTAKSANCKIELALDGNLKLPGDSDQLQQVMQNLIENAIKYGSSKQHIDVSAKDLGHITEVSVRDFGAGIASHHIPRLTERFYRVDIQESRTRGGTGLGLAIVKHIVGRHRGKLLIASELGQGSCFTVQLPNL